MVSDIIFIGWFSRIIFVKLKEIYIKSAINNKRIVKQVNINTL